MSRFLHVAFGLLTLALLNLTVNAQAFGASESILWDFGNGTDGSSPAAGLIIDAAGNLYGTTNAGGAYGGGTVFKLIPPSIAGENWSESVLWDLATAPTV